MRINHNILAIHTFNNQKRTNNQLANTLEKLSSGLSINQAADNAAGLAISEKMRAQIRGLGQAERNIQDGVSLIQVAEAGLAQIHEYLQRARELSVQAANDTATTEDRQVIQQEISQIRAGINNIANQTTFNGIHLLNVGDAINQSENISGDVTRYPKVATQPWTQILPLNEESIIEFNAAVHNNNDGKTVVVGRYGKVLTSMNGEDWVMQTPVIEHGTSYVRYMDVIWAEEDSQYVVVGEEGAVLTSSDGDSWTVKSTNLANKDIRSIAFNGEQYVAVGMSSDNVLEGFIATSTDLENWTITTETDPWENPTDPNATWQTTSNSFSRMNSITWSPELKEFIVTGHGRVIGGSADGSTWTARDAVGQEKYDVEWFDDKYWIIGTHSYVSEDGYNWERIEQNGQAIAYNGTEYVVGWGGWGASVAVSEDGEAWNDDPHLKYGNYLFDVTWIGNRFLAVGGQGKMWLSSAIPGTEGSKNNDSEAAMRDPDTLILQVGPNQGDQFVVDLTDARTSSLNIDYINVLSNNAAQHAIEKLDKAIEAVSSERSKYGAYTNALDHIHNNVTNYEENLVQAESRIRDANIAKESMKLTKLQLLAQASQAMLSQSNQLPEGVIQLLN